MGQEASVGGLPIPGYRPDLYWAVAAGIVSLYVVIDRQGKVITEWSNLAPDGEVGVAIEFAEISRLKDYFGPDFAVVQIDSESAGQILDQLGISREL